MGYRVKPFTMAVRDNSTQEFVDVGLLGSDVAQDIEELEDKLDKRAPWVTPEEFGAVGDGVTDDSNAINAAIATGHVRFATGKTYVANIVTPEDEYVFIDFQGSLIIGSLTIQQNQGRAYTRSGRTIIKNGTVYAPNTDAAILIKARTYRTVIDSMYVKARKNGIVCGENEAGSGVDGGGDCLISNCFVNVDPGYEDTSEYGIKCISTDNKIVDCRIYAFKTGLKVRSLDTVENVQFLYRGDFSTNWASAVAIETENSPTFNNVYIDTYKIGFKMSGDGTINANNLTYFNWRQDVGQINGFINTNGYSPRLFINNFNINLAYITMFRTINAVGPTIYCKSYIQNVHCDDWSKIYTYDICRQAIRKCYYSGSVSGNTYRLVGRYYAPFVGGYFVKLPDRQYEKGYHTIYLVRTGAGTATAEKVDDTSDLMLQAQLVNGVFLDLYASHPNTWYFQYCENDSNLIDLYPGEGPADTPTNS